jgi:hypothetical protein
MPVRRLTADADGCPFGGAVADPERRESPPHKRRSIHPKKCRRGSGKAQKSALKQIYHIIFFLFAHAQNSL